MTLFPTSLKSWFIKVETYTTKRLFPITKSLIPPVIKKSLKNTMKHHPEMSNDLGFCEKKHDFKMINNRSHTPETNSIEIRGQCFP